MTNSTGEHASTGNLVPHKLLGSKSTLMDVYILQLVVEASSAVVRIRKGNGETGTGFLCGEDLIMTCNHIVSSQREAHETMYEFFHERNEMGTPIESIVMRAQPQGAFYTNPRGSLDFTLVEIEETPDNVHPLRLARLQVPEGEMVSIVHHPEGQYKKVSMQDNYVMRSSGTEFYYSTLAGPRLGSSGAPVFDMDFNVLGIHHAGETIFESTTGKRHQRNAGVAMLAILDDIETNVPGVYQKLNGS